MEKWKNGKMEKWKNGKMDRFNGLITNLNCHHRTITIWTSGVISND